jgi:hypothetical protein
MVPSLPQILDLILVQTFGCFSAVHFGAPLKLIAQLGFQPGRTAI